jgi:hypothetical protein
MAISFPVRRRLATGSFRVTPTIWIRHNKINWASQWSDREIAEVHRGDAENLEHYLAGRARSADVGDPSLTQPRPSRLRWILGVFGRHQVSDQSSTMW